MNPTPEPAIMDMEAFRAKYPDWLESTRPLLEAANWGEAFKTYPHVVNTSAPWAPFTAAITGARLGLVSTAGLFDPASQAPFDAENIEGDHTHRAIPMDTPLEALSIAHTHYPHRHAEQDLNAVLPLERLRAMREAGEIGALAANAYSISGYCTRVDTLTSETIPQLVDALRGEGVDAVLLVPV